MTPQEEEAIERYILAPGSLSASERKKVRRCLRHDRVAQAWEALLRDTYARAFDPTVRMWSPPPVDAFLKGLYRK